ncbi:hypothetical protein ANOM_002006 [Aspergillus nomiae NRRL 13137]|uniref:DUF6604 domain-containing protein n=1 Tax=Aspergillus nomiae NRRL (strain ATCC 15546 / NRRL 13137 / CBS 260.88 / M93) TaxID=1509407 RepID=A0A0L1JDA3_ASPN3|nr:uncharacterized protein ANOM_002006 [Aspergillus nomiae NRRL 13137]KNG89764.1 hypothetical protein ANOM_002006 [Aspergillus nomiae NRRL 13137]
MADKNTYLKYKRDQRLLVYWITNTSNQIIKTSAPGASIAINTTGKVSLATLKSLSELIAKYIKPIPPTIFRLFKSIIEARKNTHSQFLRIVASNPDPDIQKSNDAHRHWINGLTEAFNALGGESWLSEQKSNLDVADEDEEEVVFANKFSTLSLNVSAGEDQGHEDEDDNDDEEQVAATVRSKAKAGKKGKKGRRTRKPKTKVATAALTPCLDEVPLESYRIIEDETGIITDYLMATYSFVRQWVELRHYLQGVWRDVAYNGLNSAVAATLSNIAIAMIKDTQSQIFVDFPGHESFETIMKTITRGDPDKAQGMFQMELHQTCTDGSSDLVEASELDVREEFLIHSYQNLVDFMTDFQKTHSGKPTKNMSKEIRDWDPTLDLERATKEQRLRWRRSYTINWLYDLVNINSSIVVQRRTLRGQKIPLETVDWSETGPWHFHRRLFGITEFAGEITHFAVQKPGAKIQSSILPHHVFQLQCIVDSLTVSRGWSFHILVGHVLGSPASEFRPRRDVDLFMDRDQDKPMSGYCTGVEVLSQCFEKDAMLHGDPQRHEKINTMLHGLRDDFVNWLGESKYMYGLATIPPSRFSHINANGLWEYSPFLCGAGLMEALELAYGMGLAMWDRVPEPLCVIHLHNMLVQKGYISQPVGLYDTFEKLFAESFYANGKAPTSNFEKAFEARVGPPRSRRETFRRRQLGRQVAKYATDVHGLLDSNTNRFFQAKSFLRLYRAARWVPDRIPDEDIPIPSILGLFRLTEAKRVTDPVTGRIALEDIDLVKRARSVGMDDRSIIEISSQWASLEHEQTIDPKVLESIKTNMPEGYEAKGLGVSTSLLHSTPRKSVLGIAQYLEALKLDIFGEICGDTRPVLSVNYVMVLVCFMILFMRIEDELKSRRNPLWVQAYEGNTAITREKRLSLTALVLAQEDEECMQVMADAFQNLRLGFKGYIYWDDLYKEGSKMEQNSDPFGLDTCMVM